MAGAHPRPGCKETTVAARLTDEDRAKSRAPTDAPSPLASPEVRTVYTFDDEALYEASNDTIHLMLHVAVVGEAAPPAVYIESRGARTPVAKFVGQLQIAAEDVQAWRRVLRVEERAGELRLERAVDRGDVREAVLEPARESALEHHVRVHRFFIPVGTGLGLHCDVRGARMPVSRCRRCASIPRPW